MGQDHRHRPAARRISLSIKQAAEGGEVSEEYREAFGEHAYDAEGNYVGPYEFAAEAEFTPETEAQAAWADYVAEHGPAEGGAEGAPPRVAPGQAPAEGAPAELRPRGQSRAQPRPRRRGSSGRWPGHRGCYRRNRRPGGGRTTGPGRAPPAVAETSPEGEGVVQAG